MSGVASWGNGFFLFCVEGFFLHWCCLLLHMHWKAVIWNGCNTIWASFSCCLATNSNSTNAFLTWWSHFMENRILFSTQSHLWCASKRQGTNLLNVCELSSWTLGTFIYYAQYKALLTSQPTAKLQGQKIFAAERFHLTFASVNENGFIYGFSLSAVRGSIFPHYLKKSHISPKFHTHTRARTHPRTHTRTHADIPTPTHTHTHAHARTHTHTHIHARTHTHLHTHYSKPHLKKNMAWISDCGIWTLGISTKKSSLR